MERRLGPEGVYPPRGIYEHCKSTPEDRRYYRLLGFARDTEADEMLAVYTPRYDVPSEGEVPIRARLLYMFTESTEGTCDYYKSVPESNGYYRMLGYAEHTESGEVLALYAPLNEVPEETRIAMYVRPLDMFSEHVEVNGHVVPRFTYVCPEA